MWAPILGRLSIFFVKYTWNGICRPKLSLCAQLYCVLFSMCHEPRWSIHFYTSHCYFQLTSADQVNTYSCRSYRDYMLHPLSTHSTPTVSLTTWQLLLHTVPGTNFPHTTNTKQNQTKPQNTISHVFKTYVLAGREQWTGGFMILHGSYLYWWDRIILRIWFVNLQLLIEKNVICVAACNIFRQKQNRIIHRLKYPKWIQFILYIHKVLTVQHLIFYCFTVIALKHLKFANLIIWRKLKITLLSRIVNQLSINVLIILHIYITYLALSHSSKKKKKKSITIYSVPVDLALSLSASQNPPMAYVNLCSNQLSYHCCIIAVRIQETWFITKWTPPPPPPITP